MTDQPEYTDLHAEAAESPPPEPTDDLPKTIPADSFSAPPYADDPNLAEMLGRFVRAPRQTFELLRGVLYELQHPTQQGKRQRQAVRARVQSWHGIPC